MACAIPGDLSFNSVTLLCHADGTNGQTTSTDNSNSAHALTLTGATLSTAQAKFGPSSFDFSAGTTRRVTSANGTDWSFGSAPFTVECFVRLGTAQLAGFITHLDTSPNFGWWFGMDSASVLIFYYSTIGSNLPVGASGAWSPTLNTWYHVAADRDAGGTLRLYVDGVVTASASMPSAIFQPTALLALGNDTRNTRQMLGYLDEARITKGVARYGGAFTPPTVAFPDGLPCAPASGILFRGLGSIAYPSPCLVAALAGARAIVRNAPTTRRGLLRLPG